ncbi:calcium-translocating P-type ATPase, PMCA-type [Fimbriiglobus ruber]|uniref:P-type Ca(2+) transporter n=1 Tax=Fimbriiglobus ruber TaxID=1908690 RepID=A0A225E1A3_9BACT|nr:calcium-translocating P-type ATPase, PMCA-type [Fimbriiglobus ruber]OWK47372.1 Lead, cadmium, zinc and mercury transporting ATPase [Fimbriiglobus ruber]
MRTLRSVFDLFPDARTGGLTDADVAASRGRFGVNRLTPLPREPGWKKFLEKFDEPIIKILLGASLLKIVVDVFDSSAVGGGVSLLVVAVVTGGLLLARLGAWVPTALFTLAVALFGLTVGLGHPSVEGLAVMIAVALATGVAFVSEYRSDREFEALNAQKDSIHVKVVRGGKIRTVPLEEVAVGDLVFLETGDEIPADGRVVKSNELLIDQSLMTGEAEPVRKEICPEQEAAADPDQPGCVYRGTQVVDGLGEMVVTNVGDDTMIGQIARRMSGEDDTAAPATGVAAPDGNAGPTSPEGASLSSTESRVQRKLALSKESTPLQEKLTALAELISKVGYAAAGLIFLALLLRGALWASPREVFVPQTAADVVAVARNLLGYFVYMVIIVVVAVPEGLPMSVTVSLALAMRKMTRANSLVRQLVACETIGSATVICTDKTGTLTQNKMRLVRLALGGQVYETGTADCPTPKPHVTASTAVSPVDWLAVNAAVNSTASLEEKDGKPIVVGNSTEGALLYWLRDGGTNYEQYRVDVLVVFRTAFSSEHKKMTTVVRAGGRLVALVKGAPEVIIERCTKVLAADGTVRTMTTADREHARAELATAAGQAMRTLAFAHVELPADFPTDTDAVHDRRAEIDRDLTFVGFVAIRDPLRVDVRDAIRQCREAGIEVKMITGDNIETARAIAAEVGLLDSPGAIAMTSTDFNKLTDDELKERLPNLRVLARAKPLDKYRMVKLLQEQNHVVAMTGDGTNDAPSLKKADVGLAMGLAGTEVAKEASKIVLLDDSFGTIVRAVHWGRSLYENIQRFVQFQLTINVSALAIALLGPFLGFRPPFTVLQLLWINVIMDTFAAIALCSEPPRAGLMRVPPKRRNESILTPAMRQNILITGTFFVVVMLGILWAMAGTPERPGLFGTSDPAAQWLVRAGVDEGVAPAASLAKGDDGVWTAAGADGSRRPVQVEFTVLQATLFFTIYVFFQVWNQINCRSLTPDASGLRGLWKNPLFLFIAGLTIVGQVVIVAFGGRVFNTEPLTLWEWLAVAAGTASVLVFAEVARVIRKAV